MWMMTTQKKIKWHYQYMIEDEFSLMEMLFVILELEVAFAISASNEWRLSSLSTAGTRLNDLPCLYSFVSGVQHNRPTCISTGILGLLVLRKNNAEEDIARSLLLIFSGSKAAQTQQAVTEYFPSKQLLPIGFVERSVSPRFSFNQV